MTARQGEISAAWSKAIADYRQFDNPVTGQDLTRLTEQILQLLLSEPFQAGIDRVKAQEIGAALLGRAFTNPELLGLSLQALAEQIPTGLAGPLFDALNPRLAALLSDLAIGFTRQMAQVILHQQEQMRAAVDSARLQAEQAQREVEDRNRAIIQAIPDALIITDLLGQILFYQVGNPNRIQMDPKAVLGRNIQELVPADVARTAMSLYKKAQQTGELQLFVWTFPGRESTLTFEARVVPYTPEQILVLNRDITELKRAEETLQHTNQLLQQLNQQLILAQENERLAIARDLHDVVLNQIGALIVTQDSDSPKVLYENFQLLVEQLRQTINILRPPLLNYGLRPALSELVDDLADHYSSNTRLELQVPDSQARFDPAIEAHLFRIVQQACENALRHAQSNQILITGQITPERVDLTVKDDGAGFEVEEPLELGWALANKHFGIAGMLERGELIGARVRISSGNDSGTQVNIYWQPG